MNPFSIPHHYTPYPICCKLIKLDDNQSGSVAVYTADNPNCEQFLYYKPESDHIEQPRKPRCDYMLIKVAPGAKPRLIELKGLNHWGHAFQQFYCTHDEFKNYIDEEFEFVLCVSIERGQKKAKYETYEWYRRLKESLPYSMTPIILFLGERDALT